jgi:hypothetical protein
LLTHLRFASELYQLDGGIGSLHLKTATLTGRVSINQPRSNCA